MSAVTYCGSYPARDHRSCPSSVECHTVTLADLPDGGADLVADYAAAVEAQVLAVLKDADPVELLEAVKRLADAALDALEDDHEDNLRDSALELAERAQILAVLVRHW